MPFENSVEWVLTHAEEARNEIEELRARNEYLETENTALKTERIQRRGLWGWF